MPRYRVECGQCDFGAASAAKMERHLLTHGIVLHSGSGKNPVKKETPKPHPRQKKGRKRSSLVVKVKDEPKHDDDEIGADFKPLGAEELNNAVEEPAIEKVSVPEPGEDGNKLIEKYKGRLSQVSDKTQDATLVSDSKTGDSVVEGVPLEDPRSNPTNVPLDGDQHVEEGSADAYSEQDLHLALSDADVSGNSSVLNNSAAWNSSATMSIPNMEAEHFLSAEVKKEPVDLGSGEPSCHGGVPMTPESCMSPVVTTPPDHDYPQRPHSSTVEEHIPDSLRNEFMMNCVSIKQEDFDKMCMTADNAKNDNESGVIVIAPDDDENKADELRSFVDGCHDDAMAIKSEISVKQEKLETEETSDSSCSGAQLNKADAAKQGSADLTVDSTGLIKTSVLKSILMGASSSQGKSPAEKQKVPKNIAPSAFIGGRKMYSLPCTFTDEGKLRLVPVTSSQVTHYIVVVPGGAKGKTPCLFLVAKSKIEGMSPKTAILNAAIPSRKKKIPVKRQSPPSAKLVKARSQLFSVLAKASGKNASATPPTATATPPAPTPPSPEEEKEDSPVKTTKPATQSRDYYCRMSGCEFWSSQYYTYQSHVMRCWQDHGFMVCDILECNMLFRTKSQEDFKSHCQEEHPNTFVHCCRTCMFLGTNKSQMNDHQAMYHQDLYAPETPFASMPLYNKPWKRRVWKTTGADADSTVDSTEKTMAAAQTGSEPVTNLFLDKKPTVSMQSKTAAPDPPPVIGDISGMHPPVQTSKITSIVNELQPSPRNLTPSKQASKQIKELLANHLAKNAESQSHSAEGSDICYSAKKLEQTLEPATKILTKTVQAKCLQDLQYSFQRKQSPTKRGVNEIHVHVYIKEEPEDVVDNNGKSTLSEGQIESNEQHSKISDQQPAINSGESSDKNVSNQPNQKDHSKTDGISEEPVSTPESGEQMPEEYPERNVSPDFEEYFDGTVDENFVFDHQFDDEDMDNNAAEDIFDHDYNPQDDDHNYVADNSPTLADSVANDCIPPTEPSDPVLPKSNNKAVKKLILEDIDGEKSEVLLQPPPRQSGRVRKRKVCTGPCCVDSSSKKRRQPHSHAKSKAKTEESAKAIIIKKEVQDIVEDNVDNNVDNNVDMKLESTPVVVLINIMSLVKPLLGLQSPVKVPPVPETYSRKQTARKSTAKRSRVAKKSRCSCCAE